MILKSPESRTNCSYPFIFTSNARMAWQLVLESLKSSHPDGILLLPAYIGYTDREGSGIFDPVEVTGFRYAFYRVNDELSVSLHELEELVERVSPVALLIVHYFGFCRNEMNQIRDLCNEKDILLVEDCAHYFSIGIDTSGLGSYGDFAFYSVHKYLPTAAGGILRRNTDRLPLRALKFEERASADDLEQIARTDFDSILRCRKLNFSQLENCLREIEGIAPIYNLQDGDIPLNYPIRVENGCREKLYFHLMEKGMPTIALYYRLIEELRPNEFPLSFAISNEILNLPVHQDVTTDEIELMLEAIKVFLSANR